MVPREGDTFTPRTLKDVEPASILLLEMRLAVVIPSRGKAQVSGHGNGLEENLGHDDRTSQVEPDPPFQFGDRAQSVRKSSIVARPRFAPSMRGVMCTMSVPIATWTVTGI